MSSPYQGSSWGVYCQGHMPGSSPCGEGRASSHVGCLGGGGPEDEVAEVLAHLVFPNLRSLAPAQGSSGGFSGQVEGPESDFVYPAAWKVSFPPPPGIPGTWIVEDGPRTCLCPNKLCETSLSLSEMELCICPIPALSHLPRAQSWGHPGKGSVRTLSTWPCMLPPPRVTPAVTLLPSQ